MDVDTTPTVRDRRRYDGAWARRAALAVLLLCGALLSMPVATAVAAGTGSITGTVTAKSTGMAIEGIEVCAEAAEGEGEGEPPEGCAHTDSAGNYTISGLPEGTYEVTFYSGEGEKSLPYAPQVYDEKDLGETASPVRVTANTVTENIDAKLVLGGTIIGTITNASGTSVAGVEACALKEVAGKLGAVECEVDNAQGQYKLTKLAPGTYKVGFVPLESKVYISPEYYDSAISAAAAKTVVVEAGQTTTLAASQLQEGGRITGTVTDDTIYKRPIAETEVCAVAATGLAAGYGCAITNGSGEYTISGLKSQEYYVAFGGRTCTVTSEGTKCVKQYAVQYYNGKTKAAEAERVTVTAPQTAGGIDAVLVPLSSTPPSNTATPTLLGEGVVGDTLTCSAGAWANGPTALTYQWRRDGTAIEGQTAGTYLVQQADAGHAISCQVTVSNSAGVANATSNAVHVPPPAPGSLIAKHVVKVRGRHALIAVSCAGPGACKGTVKLVYRERIRRHGKRHVRRVVVGRAHFALQPNGSELLKVKLTTAGAGYVAKAGKHGLRVRLAGHGVKARMLVLRQAKRRKGSSRHSHGHGSHKHG